MEAPGKSRALLPDHACKELFQNFMKVTISAILFCLISFGTSAQPKSIYRNPGSALSPFRIQKTNGQFYYAENLKKNEPLLLIIFSPDCGHCEHALDTLQRSFKPELKGLQVVLVTEAAHKAQLAPFLEKSGLGKDPVFSNVGIDSSNLIYNVYAYGMLPQFNYYNSKHKLVKTFTGIFPLDSLRTFLHQQPKH